MAIDCRSVKLAWRRLMALLRLRSLFEGRELTLPRFRSDFAVNRSSLLQLVQNEAYCPQSFMIFGLIMPVIFVIFQSKSKLLHKIDLTVQIQLTVSAFIAFYCNRGNLRNRCLTEVLSMSEVSQASQALQNKLTSRLKRKQNWLFGIITCCFVLTGFVRLYWYFTLPNDVDDTKTGLFWVVLTLLDVISVTYRVAVLLLCAMVFQTRCIVQLLWLEEFSEGNLEGSELDVIFNDLEKFEKSLDSIGIDHQLCMGAFVIITTISELLNAFLLVKGEFNCKSIELIVTTLYLIITVLMCMVHAVKIADQLKIITHGIDKWSTLAIGLCSKNKLVYDVYNYIFS